MRICLNICATLTGARKGNIKFSICRNKEEFVNKIIMKQKKGFVLRDICGQKVLSGEGLEQVNFSKLISLNETAAFLWEKMVGLDFTARTMADALCEEYEVEPEVALKDAEALCAKWQEIGLIEG